MPTIALVSGFAALVAGAVKFGIDAYRAKHTPASVNISIGEVSVQVPSSYTPSQVASLVTALKDKAESGTAP